MMKDPDEPMFFIYHHAKNSFILSFIGIIGIINSDNDLSPSSAIPISKLMLTTC